VSEERQLLVLRPILKEFYEITLRLQRADITFAEMRTLFDTLIDMYPQMGHYIGADSPIIHSPVFIYFEYGLIVDAVVFLFLFLFFIIDFVCI
jgi:hypothetical protein